MDNPLVSIVILNWNGLSSTKVCLESLKGLKYPKLELILVDNGSTDGSKSKLPGLLKKSGLDIPYEFIDLPRNTGFTGGHIAGLNASHGEILFLLNNDSVVDPEIVNRALEVFGTDEKIAAVGGRAFFWNDTNPIFNDKNQYYSFQTINPITAEVTTLEEGLKECEPNNVSGSAVFIKRSVIDKVGYLDNRFFAYYEESDLFARMKRSGYRVIYSPNVKIWHRVGESTKDKPAFFYYLIFRNQFLYAAKNFDKRFFRYFLRYYFYTFFLKAILYSAMGRGQDKLMNKARLKSFFWNVGHIVPTILARQHLLQTYGPGYSDRLIEENFQPISVLIDGEESTKPQLKQTLESLGKQTVRPLEIVVVTRENLGNEDLEDLDGLRQVVDQRIFDVPPWNLALICSNQPWLLFIKAGETINRDFLKSAFITALRTQAEIIYPAKINNGTTPGRFSLRGFKKHNFLGHNLFISQHVMRSIGGLDNRSKSEALAWELVASAIMLAHIKIRRSEATVSQVDSVDVSGSVGYPEFNRLSPLRYWIWTSPQPIGRLFRTLKAIFLASKLATFLKVIATNLKAPKYQGSISMPRIMIALITFRPNVLKAALIHNYDLVKKQRQVQQQQSSPAAFDLSDLPVFINCRDRATDLKRLVAWLQKVGVRKIALVDNDSSYPELLKFYDKSQCQVLPLGVNHGQKAPWESLAVGILAKDSYYIVSDPDVIPIQDCPDDALGHFHEILQKYKTYMKVGFGLKIDDIPDRYLLKKTVVNWEKQFWQNELEPDIYIADIDTTFALYRPNTWYFLENSLRTGYPYIAEHTAWYQDSKRPSAEDRYYQQHASRAVNTWNMDDIPEHFKAAIAKADA